MTEGATNKTIYPYLAYSALTDRVYIMLNKNGDKIDVTSRFDWISKERGNT